MKEKFKKKLLSVEKLVKYARNQVKLINKRSNESFTRKKGNWFRKWAKNYGFRQQKMGLHRGFISGGLTGPPAGIPTA
jgi:hypothetical protein